MERLATELERWSLARERWKILRSAILSSKSDDDRHSSMVPNSVAGFSSFSLFTVIPASSPNSPQNSDTCDSEKELKFPPTCQRDSEKWVRYKATIDESSVATNVVAGPLSDESVEVVVKFVNSENVSLETLVGFNNTGNIRVWPSEEVMAYYCLKHVKMFRNASVCELGGGMTSLSGLILAATQMPSRVLLTDGNHKAVDNLQEIIANNVSLTGNNVSAEVMVWDQSFLDGPSAHDSSFDYILCADCTFFTEFHLELAKVILKVMKSTGEAIIFAPKRNGTLEQFCVVARKFFDVQVINTYDNVVWLKHITLQRTDEQYEVDLHYPLMISLKKINDVTSQEYL